MKDSIKEKIILGALKSVAIWPLPVLYVVSDVICFIVHRILKYRVKSVRRNLSLVFPDYSEKQRRRIENAFYHHLCDCIVETIKLLHISDEEVDKRVVIKNAEYVDSLLKEGNSVVLMLGHYGNWEWVQPLVHAVREGDVKGQIYSPLHNKVMDNVMLKIRSRFGNVNIPMKSTVRQLLKATSEGKRFLVGFISDQRPTTRVYNNWTDFLGIETPIMVGGEAIAEKVGAKMVYGDFQRQKRGYYILTFRPIVPPAEDTEPYPYTREFFRMLEKSIIQAPQYWLWSHNRWRNPRRAATPRPNC